MKDSDIDTLSADGAQEARPQTAAGRAPSLERVAVKEHLMAKLPEEAAERLILAIEAEAAADPSGLRTALSEANLIIKMFRDHCAQDHPECAYTGLGVMQDQRRAALASTPPVDAAAWEGDTGEYSGTNIQVSPLLTPPAADHE